MPGAHVAGSFATGRTASLGQLSDVCVIPHSRTAMLLTITGADASNTVKTQKRASSSVAWGDVTTYNSNQSAVSVAVVANEEWRLAQVTQQPIRDIRFVLDAE
jgi:hypothetical protein